MARPAPSRILDRTFICSTIARGGFRKVNAFAQAGVREFGDPKTWKSLAHAWFQTGSIYDGPFIGAGAGAPPPEHSSAGLFLRRKRCRSSAGRLALSPADLGGGPAGQLGDEDEYECEAPRTVLVRIRAVFRSPTRLAPKPFGHLGTGAVTRQAAMAVATRGGKPIAYVAVFESGTAQLFTRPNCVPE